AVVLITGLAATGCSANNYQATTHVYSASDGAMFDAENVQLRHIMFVTADANSPARMLGLINNSVSGDAEVEVAVGSDTFEVQLEPGEAVNLEHDEELVASSIEAAPGQMQEVSVSVSVDGGGSG